MQAFYCHRCNRPIPIEEVDEGRVIRYEGNIYCGKCAEELRRTSEVDDISASVEVVSEVTPLPEGVVRCGRCQKPIEPEQLAKGEAIVATDGRAYCPECTQLVMPLFEALQKQSDADTSEEQAPVVEPASDITSPPLKAHFPAPVSTPSKSYMPFIALAGIIVLIIVILIAVGGEGPETPSSGGAITHKPTPKIEPISGFDKELQKNTDLLLKKLKQIISDWEEDRDHDTTLRRLSELKDMRVTYEAHQNLLDAIRRVEEAKKEDKRRLEEEAYREYEAIRTRVERNIENGNFKAARDAVYEYPERLRSIGKWWRKTQALEELIRRSEEAKERFTRLKERVEQLLKEKKLYEARKVVVLAEEDFKGTPYQKKHSELLRGVDEKIAEEERRKREAEERRRKMLEAVRSQSPVFYADFRRGRIEGTFAVVMKECGFPFLIPSEIVASSPKTVRFLKQDGTSEVELRFSLAKSPEVALLILRTALPEPTPTTVYNTEVEVLLNGKSIKRQSLIHPTGGGGEFDVEFELKKDFLKAGENSIRIRQTGGTVLFWLIRVELRLALSDDALKSLRKTVDAKKEKIEKENAQFLRRYNETAMREWRLKIDRKGRRPPRRNEWTYLFNGATLDYWRALDGNAEWKVENGAIIGVNRTNNRWSVLEPVVRRMYNWLEYDLEFELVFGGRGLAYVGFYRNYDFGFRAPTITTLVGHRKEAADKTYIGKALSLLVEVRQKSLTLYLGGKKQTTMLLIEKDRRPGYFCIVVGPNSAVRIKDIRIRLYKTK